MESKGTQTDRSWCFYHIVEIEVRALGRLNFYQREEKDIETKLQKSALVTLVAAAEYLATHA